MPITRNFLYLAIFFVAIIIYIFLARNDGIERIRTTPAVKNHLNTSTNNKILIYGRKSSDLPSIPTSMPTMRSAFGVGTGRRIDFLQIQYIFAMISIPIIHETSNILDSVPCKSVYNTITSNARQRIRYPNNSSLPACVVKKSLNRSKRYS